MIRTSEKWAPIKGYEGVYEVSNLGLVRRVDFRGTGKPRNLKPADNGTGYLFVTLCKNGIVKRFYVHRLVAEAFIENSTNLPEVNHKDECRSNNHVTNLEWCTREYNQNYGNKLKNRSKIVEAISLDGKIKLRFESIQEAGRSGFNLGHVSSCLKLRRRSHKGFTWKYVETLEESV